MTIAVLYPDIFLKFHWLKGDKFKWNEGRGSLLKVVSYVDESIFYFRVHYCRRNLKSVTFFHHIFQRVKVRSRYANFRQITNSRHSKFQQFTFFLES